MGTVESDYLVVGAGLAGMAFVDSLVTEADVDVVLVDRRHRPGGHWNDAYPFVRLHLPSANYGVNSTALGADSIDTTGPNAGLYERATAAEICDYFLTVLEQRLLASGRVHFLGMTDYVGLEGGEHTLVSRMTGTTTTVRVRRRLVDATYLESSVPATHRRTFTVDPDARCIPIGELVNISEAPSGYTVLGAGKTGIDACLWLLDEGVDPDVIRWIRPRDPWLLDRTHLQPLDQVAVFMDSYSRQIEASALATSIEDFLERFEDGGLLLRIDPGVTPGLLHGATVTTGELDALRSIEHVVSLGRVRVVGSQSIELDHGTVPTDARHVHVDCTAIGLSRAGPRPVFEPERITLQQVRHNSPSINAAFLGFLEGARDDDTERNRLSAPNPYPDVPADWPANLLATQRSFSQWQGEPDVVAWLGQSRLDISRGIGEHFDEPLMQEGVARLLEYGEQAVDNLQSLLA